MSLLSTALRPTARCAGAVCLLALAPLALAQSPAEAAATRETATRETATRETATRETAARETGKQSPERARPRGELVVGVVDISKVILQYPLYIELNQQLKANADQRNQQLAVLEQQIEELQGTIQVLEGGDERDEKQFQLKIAAQRHEFLAQSFTVRQRIESEQVLLRVYQDIDAAIDMVARKLGVALVLSRRDITPSETAIADMDPRNVKARVDAFESRKLWFASEELDITSDVIKRMQRPLDGGDARAAAGERGAAGGADEKGGGE